MKIAIFSDTFPPEINGVASFVHHSAKSLAERGHEVQVFTVSKIPKKRLNEKIGKYYFKVNTIPSISARVYPDIRIGIPAGTMLPRLIKFYPDIIHTHTPFTMGWEAVLGAKILRVPLMGTHHTFYDHYLKHLKIDFAIVRRFSWKYTIRFYNFCNLVTAPSRSLVKEMTGHKIKTHIEVLPNFVDTFIFKPANEIEKRKYKKDFRIIGPSIVYMGRLSYEKSIDQVIRAFKLITKDSPCAKLMIVGDGPDRNKLVNLAKKLKINNKIIFTGFLRGKKLVKALQTNDLFVTASKTESFCIAALEAMAVGLPIVAVREKGCCEVIQDKQNGFLAEPDNVKDVAKKIIEIINNEKLMKQFSNASRSLALKYSKKNVTVKLERIYKKLINNY